MESIKKTENVDTDKTFHNTKNWMLNYPVTKQFGLALCIVKCCFVSEWVTRANSHIFIKEISNFMAAMIIQIFPVFIQKIAIIPAFFCSFCKVLSLYISQKKARNLTVNQASTVPHFSVQVSCTTKNLFCGFVFLGGQNQYPLTFSILKAPNFLITFKSANSTSSTMQDILLQKS